MTGVFYVNRQEPQTAVSKKRPLTAIAYRISGNSRFYYNNTVITAAKGSVIYIPAGVDLLAVVAANEHAAAVCDIARTKLD